MIPELYALLVMVCLAAGPATIATDDGGIFMPATRGQPAASCRLHEPPWATKLSAKECSAMKAAMSAPIVGPGARLECIPLDVE